MGGSFFDAVPPADCYLMKWILHDWSDDECVTILRRCRESLRPDGVVLVVELLLDRPGHERFTALMDLQMLVVAGGRERTEAEFAALFERAGLRLTRVVDTATPFAILEAVGRGRAGYPVDRVSRTFGRRCNPHERPGTTPKFSSPRAPRTRPRPARAPSRPPRSRRPPPPTR